MNHHEFIIFSVVITLLGLALDLWLNQRLKRDVLTMLAADERNDSPC